MTIKWSLEQGNTGVVHVTGTLRKNEAEQVQQHCKETIEEVGNIKLLVILDEFTGWEKAEGWEDNSFAEQHDKYIDKFAIVGDDKWRDMAYMFTLKGLRPVDIEFFNAGDETEARQWLVES